MTAMAMASTSSHSFLTGRPFSTLSKPTNFRPCSFSTIFSCQASNQEQKGSSNKVRNEVKLARLAMVALTAGVLALGSVDGAMAAKSGGRVGGQAFRPSAPRSSGPRINNSRTNIYINPPVAPPLVGGYGYGGSPFFGGYGWSPFSYFAPGPSVAIGVGGGFDVLVTFVVLGTVAGVIRRFFGRRDDGDDYDE